MKKDSTFTLEKAISTSTAPKEILDTLSLIDIPYWGFDDTVHVGQLVVSSQVAVEIKTIFNTLLEKKFPIQKMIPIVAYSWDDRTSILDNNTSSFNYRNILNTENLSTHSFGTAIDINPLLNPYMLQNGTSWPEGYTYDTSLKGTIVDGDIVVQTFTTFGWEWAGHWEGPPDYQHFQKSI